MNPDWPPALAALARILASSDDAAIRDTPEAVRLAKHAAELTGFRNAAILNTLAAAYEADGQSARAEEVRAKVRSQK